MRHVALLLLLLSGGCTMSDSPAPPLEYTVVRGDTLSKIAARHDVTVQDLRDWNGLTGDLIEIDQVLLIHGKHPEGAASAPARQRASPKPARTAGTTPSPAKSGLTMPTPKACLAGPTDAGADDEGMSASVGLSSSQIRTAVQAFLPQVVSCVEDEVPERQLWLELTVGCDGRVSHVGVSDQAGWPDALVSCVTDRFRYAAFPAHDLPDGETFSQPIGFSR